MSQLIHKMGGDSVETNTIGVLFSDHTYQDTAAYVAPGSKQLYVDNQRTDGVNWTATGSQARPFSTISAAITQIVANGDNTENQAYVVYIAPGIYGETIDLSAPQLVNLVFVGQLGVNVGTDSMNAPVILALNNDNLQRLFFFGITFSLNGVAEHGIELTTGTYGTNFLRYGVYFNECSIQDNTEDVYVNNAGYVVFDNTGITANINITNVNQCNFVNSNGPNPQTPFNITSDGSTATPLNWVGYSSASFNGVGVGSITCDANSKVGIENCIVSGTVTTSSVENTTVIFNSAIIGSIVVNANAILGIVNSLVSQPDAPAVSTVTIDGVLLSALSFITGTAITVNSGGLLYEASGLHDDGELTVNSGGSYYAQGDLGVGTVNVFDHINTIQQDLAGQITISGGTSASFDFSTAYSASPIVVVTPTQSEPGIGWYWVVPSPTGFTVNCTNSGTCTFNYVVIGTAF